MIVNSILHSLFLLIDGRLLPAAGWIGKVKVIEGVLGVIRRSTVIVIV